MAEARGSAGRLLVAGFLTAIAVATSGCMTRPQAPDAVPAQKSDNSVWSGRLALRVESEPPDAYSAAFDLRGNAESGEIRLTSPLGSTIALVTWSPQSAQWQQGDDVVIRPTLRELTAAMSGTPLPIEAMFDWLKGQANDHAPGWQADLSRHADGRIIARRLQPLPRAELRLVFEP
ncbi:hypothetical protein NBRC116584_15320 [Hydrogenophaga sp. 5NK40-0174]